MSNSRDREPRLGGIGSIKPKALKLSQESLVSIRPSPGGQAPLIIQPDADNISLASWTENNKALLEENLLKYGAILFRGFGIGLTSQFEEVVRSVSPELIEYGERSSPRSKVSGTVYTSTDHPADQSIFLHNEQSYTLNWPMKIWFCCLVPPQQQGRTPIADSRKILSRIDAGVVEKFSQKKLMYLRNYGDGLGLSWQVAFQTSYRRDVEDHCRRAGIEFEWREGNRLRTRQVRPAIRLHPKTQEPVWFNHALFFHASSLDAATRESILAVVGEDELPFNTCYGDGTAIEAEVLEEIRAAFHKETVSFDWERGDILMLDNMLVAHGREPYIGSRRIVVCMSEPVDAARESSSARMMLNIGSASQPFITVASPLSTQGHTSSLQNPTE